MHAARSQAPPEIVAAIGRLRVPWDNRGTSIQSDAPGLALLSGQLEPQEAAHTYPARTISLHFVYLHSGRTPPGVALSARKQSDSLEAARVSIPAASTNSLAIPASYL